MDGEEAGYRARHPGSLETPLEGGMPGYYLQVLDFRKVRGLRGGTKGLGKRG
jgi:hypothetical protein